VVSSQSNAIILGRVGRPQVLVGERRHFRCSRVRRPVFVAELAAELKRRVQVKKKKKKEKEKKRKMSIRYEREGQQTGVEISRNKV